MSQIDFVFLHGWLMGPDLWDDQVRLASKTGRTLAVSQPAHGAPALPNGATMTAWADVVMVGHSMGGLLAQEVWRSRPERIRALVLVGIGDEAWPAEQAVQFTGLVDMVAKSWGPELARACADLLVGHRFLANHPEFLDSFERRVAENYDLAGMPALGRAIAAHDDYQQSSATISVPTVVIHGTADTAVPMAAGQAMASRIPGARFVAVEGAGHASPMEAAGEVSAALEELIGRL
jgi:pimeloyl-ACP methyl ester carboxylesterase